LIGGVLLASCALGQSPVRDPFPKPIQATEGAITVNFVEFASLPDMPGESQPQRMMLLINEPGTGRLFVNDMRGVLYSISHDGKTVKQYLDMRDQAWHVGVRSGHNEQGLQSFAFHPQFNERGRRGYGKFYTYLDTGNLEPKADLQPLGDSHDHDMILLEWTAKNPAAATYDGGTPRELVRFAHPFQNHNGGHLTFNPLAKPGDPDFGLLYMGMADGGSSGDPYGQAQSLRSPFGKIMRIDPLGTNSANGKYGIPASNPYAKGSNSDALREIYASGVRNPQHLFWDSKNGNMFMSDIGQNTIEKISLVTSGANLGWNVWEGSGKFVAGGARGGGVIMTEPRSDPKITYPVVEYDHQDPLFQFNVATIGGYVYRRTEIPQLTGKLIFGDNPSGEIFYAYADNLPKGGQDAIRRVLLNDHGTPKTLLQLIREKNAKQGKAPSFRCDLRFGEGPNGQIFILNKRDGTIRLLVP